MCVQVDFLALVGLTGPQFAAVQGHSAQAMSTFSTLHSLLKGLLNETAPADVAAGVVQAVYNQMKTAAPTKAAQVRSWCSLASAKEQRVVPVSALIPRDRQALKVSSSYATTAAPATAMCTVHLWHVLGKYVTWTFSPNNNGIAHQVLTELCSCAVGSDNPKRFEGSCGGCLQR